MGVFIYYRNWRRRWWQISRTIEPCYIRVPTHTYIYLKCKPLGNRQNYYMHILPLSPYNLNLSSFIIYLIKFKFFSVGWRELHKLWKRHQLAVVCCVWCYQAKRQQLGVDAFHWARAGQSHIHRSQVHYPGLFVVSRIRVILQRNFFTALLRIWRGHQRTTALGTRQLQISR